MIDVQNEQLVPIRELPNRLPRRASGRKVHISACYRWIRQGVRGVRLEAVKIGGTTYTSLEALQRFGDRQASGHEGSIDRVQPRTRQRQLTRSETQLDRLLANKSDLPAPGTAHGNDGTP